MTDRKRERPDDYFADWKEREALAEGMIPIVGRLSREKSVKCFIYGRSLVNQSVLQIMKDHRYVRQRSGPKQQGQGKQRGDQRSRRHGIGPFGRSGR